MNKITLKRKMTMFCALLSVVLFTITASIIYASADTPSNYLHDESEYKEQEIYNQIEEYDTEVLCIVTPLQ